MNYKILALSAVIGVGVITIGLMEAQRPSPTSNTTDRMVAMDVEEPQTQFGFSEAISSSPAFLRTEPEPPAPAEPQRPGSLDAGPISLPSAEIPVGMPQIAYVFTYGFRLPGASIPALQQRHADLCESKGPQICRIIAMDQSGDEGEYSKGSLQLAVASSEARDFGKQLATLAQRADGEQVATAISGEDLSKRIVDTEARLRARTLLRDRLMEVLATRRGTVTELVEAERGVAQVNEEIDQARSWLSEMKSRVAYSRLDISYQSVAPAKGGFLDPVRGAVGSLGTLFGNLLAVLIVLGALAAPFLAALIGFMALRRRLGWFAPRDEDPAPAAA
jgi:hypothetical protein